MQEVLNFTGSGVRSFLLLPEVAGIIAGSKWLVIAVWRPVRWVLDVILTPPPGQEFIEESRLKALRYMGRI